MKKRLFSLLISFALAACSCNEQIENNFYKVTIIVDETIKTFNIEHNKTIEINESLEKEGYSFQGWFTNDGIKWNIDSDVVTKDITLTAKWEANEYNIKYARPLAKDESFCEANTYYTKTVKYDEEVYIKDMNVDGYEFLGFYYNNEKVEFPFKYKYTEDILLQTKWELNIGQIGSEYSFFTYDVSYNIESGLSVYTDYEVNNSTAPTNQNISKREENINRKTVPISEEEGYYYFAIDKNGYIVYASLGLNQAYGYPQDIYYHNQDEKDIYNADYWSLHEQYANWPAQVEINGEKIFAYTLYDFLIPEGGFVIKAHVDDENFKKTWKLLTKIDEIPVNSNTTLGFLIKPKELDNYFISINDKGQLTIAERLDSNNVIIETNSKNF